MPTKLKVDLIQSDLDMAFKGDFNGCAIVAALARKYPKLQRPTVTDDWIGISDPIGRLRYKWHTPEVAREWIQDWDNDNSDAAPLFFVLNRNEAYTNEIQTKTVEQKFIEKERAKKRKAKLEQQLKAETPTQTKARKAAAAQRKAAVRRGLVKA